MEARLSARTVNGIQTTVLVLVVVLSWSFVIYASRVAADWLLEERPAPLRQH